MKLLIACLATAAVPKPGLVAIHQEVDAVGPAQRKLVAAYLKGEVTRHELLTRANADVAKMDFAKALGSVQLPEPVAAIAAEAKQAAAGDNGPGKTPEFSQDALDRARVTLNGMIETAQQEYDLKDMECRGFAENNRAEYEQTVADLSRLGSMIAADLAGITGAKGTIEETQRMLDEEKAVLEKEMGACAHTKAVNEAQLHILEADLEVAAFIVQMTKCEEALLQGGKQAPEVAECELADGTTKLTFADPELQKKAQAMLSREAQTALQVALLGVARQPNTTTMSLLDQHLRQTREKSHVALGLIKASHKKVLRRVTALVAEEPKGSLKGTEGYYYYYEEEIDEGSLDALMNAEPEPVKTPPQTEPDPQKAADKCVNSKPDCGLLNDNMALMWGDVKDSVDELRAIMAANQKQCTETENMHNIAMQTFAEIIMTKNVEITDNTKLMNENTQEQTSRNQNKDRLTKEYDEEMQKCEDILHELLHTNICGVKTVRAGIAKFSERYQPTDILDCVVSDWVPEECTKECEPGLQPDGSCDAGGPEVCLGGVQNMTRSVVQNETLGAGCPALLLEKVCNKIPCKIDCKMDDWSPFGKCSKECGGGVMTRSRNIVNGAKNGGEACAETSETQMCNTLSCDVDCVLGDWEEWGPCSRACEAGTQERKRPELAPAEGFGVCPKAGVIPFEQQTCNDFPCPPKPTCHAMQDLIFAVDVSGSLKIDGYDIVKNFLTTLLGLYHFSENATKVGVLEYSNEAKIVAPLQDDHDKLMALIDSHLAFQRGVTDMAQGMTLSQVLLQEGRKDAQSVVVVLTDGKPSFQYATKHAAKAIRDAGVRLVIVPIFQYGDPVFMQELASFPPKDNVLPIGGLEHLGENLLPEAIKLMTSTCAMLEPPEPEPAKDEIIGKDAKGEAEYKFLFAKKPSPTHDVRRVRHRRGHEVS